MQIIKAAAGGRIDFGCDRPKTACSDNPRGWSLAAREGGRAKLMKPSVYMETSIVSYVAARPSGDLVAAARQQLTHVWWECHKSDFDVWVSELVLEEAKLGDLAAAQKRIDAVADLPVLSVTPEAAELAAHLLESSGLPARAGADAVHIAIATVHHMDYLLTWNCKHIANPFIQRAVRRICAQAGYEAPTICTPEELVGGRSDD